MRNRIVVAVSLAVLFCGTSEALAQGRGAPPGPGGLVGATRADGPCFDNSNRYVNCGNGTVTDTVTGLIWLQRADCFPPLFWAASNDAAASLSDGDCSLSDGSSRGDWRLPTRDEWAEMMAHAITLACLPALTNDRGNDCYNAGGASFLGLSEFSAFWSSSTHVSFFPGSAAWNALVYRGELGIQGKGLLELPVWPVRKP